MLREGSFSVSDSLRLFALLVRCISAILVNLCVPYGTEMCTKWGSPGTVIAICIAIFEAVCAVYCC